MGCTAFDWLTPGRIWGWACDHPGTIVLGALLVSALLAPLTCSPNDAACESDVDEAHLFV